MLLYDAVIFSFPVFPMEHFLNGLFGQVTKGRAYIFYGSTSDCMNMPVYADPTFRVSALTHAIFIHSR